MIEAFALGIGLTGIAVVYSLLLALLLTVFLGE